MNKIDYESLNRNWDKLTSSVEVIQDEFKKISVIMKGKFKKNHLF